MNIYVGNLPYSITEAELEKAFSVYGQVTSSRIITDKFTNRSKGFGFVEMANDAEAKEAIEKIHNTDMGGRTVVANEARPRPEKTDRPPFRGGDRGGDRGPRFDRGPRGGGDRRGGERSERW